MKNCIQLVLSFSCNNVKWAGGLVDCFLPCFNASLVSMFPFPVLRVPLRVALLVVAVACPLPIHTSACTHPSKIGMGRKGLDWFNGILNLSNCLLFSFFP